MDDEKLYAYLGFIILDRCFPVHIAIEKDSVTLPEFVCYISDAVEEHGIYCSYGEWSVGSREMDPIAVAAGRTLFEDISADGLSDLASDDARIARIIYQFRGLVYIPESEYVQ